MIFYLYLYLIYLIYQEIKKVINDKDPLYNIKVKVILILIYEHICFVFAVSAKAEFYNLYDLRLTPLITF